MTWVDWYLIATIGVLFWGVGSVIYTLPTIRPHWRPAYWMAIPLGLTIQLALVLALLRHLFPLTGIPSELIQWSLQAGLVFVALELVLVPYIHRREAKLGE